MRKDEDGTVGRRLLKIQLYSITQNSSNSYEPIPIPNLYLLYFSNTISSNSTQKTNSSYVAIPKQTQHRVTVKLGKVETVNKETKGNKHAERTYNLIQQKIVSYTDLS